nr:50S ribosomal protein L6P [uncultured archaeon]
MKEQKAKKPRAKFEREVSLTEGVSAVIEQGVIKIKGKHGECQRGIEKGIKARLENSSILIETGNNTQRDKKKIGSVEAHIKNMVRGAANGHKYTLKVCSGHFPMNISAAGNKFTVKNFFGEKVPRAFEFSKNAKVTVEGEIIHVESADKEIAGQVAAAIEQLTRRPGFDTRVFQDGCYIIVKDGKELK